MQAQTPSIRERAEDGEQCTLCNFQVSLHDYFEFPAQSVVHSPTARSVSPPLDHHQKLEHSHSQAMISPPRWPAAGDTDFPGERVYADIECLSLKVGLWKRAWGGMSNWDNQRDRYLDCELTEDGMQGYLEQVELGNDMLDECFMLLRAHNSQGSLDAFHLASQIITFSTDIATGLERLRIADLDTA
jgi:hypothetical protein